MANAHYDYLIIGGGIAGTTAAETIRGRDAAGSIAILSAEPHPLYSRVLLPAYLKGRIARERVFLRSVDDYAAKKIDFHPACEARAADAARREITTADNKVFHFGKLLVASGGRVKPWEYQEAASSHAYRLQTIDDADRLVRDMPQIKNPLVIGSSFIALEFIEIFLRHGIMPRVLAETGGFFSAFLDKQGSDILEGNFMRHGVVCVFGEKITACRRSGEEYALTTAAGNALRADAFGIGIGIERNRDFLDGSGIALGRRGVPVDEFLESDAPDIFAAGDVAEYCDFFSGAYRTAGNWTHAVLQGRQAGFMMAGERAAFTHIPSYAITSLGMQIAVIGECSNENGFESIVRADADRLQYERIFFREGVTVGAFLVNRSEAKSGLTDMIARRVRKDDEQVVRHLTSAPSRG